MAIEYDATLIRDESNNGYYCDVPFDVEKTFGKKRVKIKALIDGVEYRGLLTPMCGIYRVMLNKTVRDKIGKTIGDTVHISVEEDMEERVVIVPEDLMDAINKADVKLFFYNLSFTHQKEYVQWILDAKKEETRKNRIEKSVEMMREKRKGK